MRVLQGFGDPTAAKRVAVALVGVGVACCSLASGSRKYQYMSLPRRDPQRCTAGTGQVTLRGTEPKRSEHDEL